MVRHKKKKFVRFTSNNNCCIYWNDILEHSSRYRSIKYSQFFCYFDRRLAWWYIGLDIGNILTL